MEKKAKRSKLPEKAARVPSIQLERKAQLVRDYLAHVSFAGSICGSMAPLAFFCHTQCQGGTP